MDKRDLGTLPHLRQSSLQQLVMVELTTNGKYSCCCVNSTIFTSKIRIIWKWSCLEGEIRYHFLFCRQVLHFSKMTITISLTFSFISKINYKNQNWYYCRFHLPGFINRSNHQHMFWKMLLIKCKKNSCEGDLLQKKKQRLKQIYFNTT